MNKVKVVVGWDRAAAEKMEEKGAEKFLQLSRKPGFHDVVEFDTAAEARAYCRGLEEGAGWDEPYWEILNIKEEI